MLSQVASSRWRFPLVMLLAALAGQVCADNITNPVHIFRSRPDLVVPVLTILEQQSELQAPGYYFVGLYKSAQDGVYIYDNDANLVYTGFGSDGSGVSHSPQTCQYQGSTHLCFYQGRQMIGWGHGHGVIVDEHYRVVKSVEPSGTYQASSDMHEFSVIHEGTSALMTQYIRSVYDLCVEPWNICDGLGYIQAGAFQEVDVEDGSVLFEWNSLTFVDPHESWVPPSSTEISGSGENPESPWDYFHINSIDKNNEGDYLISSRHCSTIYKISGKDGTVVWRLNGFKSDYTLIDGLSFSSQHDARFISDNSSMTVLSLYDNASNGYNQTKPRSQGLIISLNHETKEAKQIYVQDPPPTTSHISTSQGNFQLLPNGNKLIGYGNDAYISEHDSEGKVVFYGTLARMGVMNYRVHKFDDWIGKPLTKPAVWTYSKYGYNNDESQDTQTTEKNSSYKSNHKPEEEGMTIYISWNGATEVTHWRVHAATNPEYHTKPFFSFSSSSHHTSTLIPVPTLPPKIYDKDAKWTIIETIPKNGFETIYRDHTQAYKYIYVEALDEKQNALGVSAVQETFVPNLKMRDAFCDAFACEFVGMAGLGRDGDGDVNNGGKVQSEVHEQGGRGGRMEWYLYHGWVMRVVILGLLLLCLVGVVGLVSVITGRRRFVGNGGDGGGGNFGVRRIGFSGLWRKMNGVAGFGNWKGRRMKMNRYQAFRLEDVIDEND